MVVRRNSYNFFGHFIIHAESGGKTHKIPNPVSAKHVFLDDIFIPPSFLFKRHQAPKLYNRDSMSEFFHDAFFTRDS